MVSYAQLEGLWINAGGPVRMAPTMAAIAEAESGGNPAAYNPSGATGLWQILYPPFAGNRDDPEVNARMAVAIWKRQGLDAWQTYTQGTYRRFLRRGVKPADYGGGDGDGGGRRKHGFSPYRNPLRAVQELTPERIDMGVDYSGQGPVYALGPGIITGTAQSGWPGEAYISERLTAGPLAGRSVYMAEDVTPTVRVGQRVSSGTIIGRMFEGGSGIETGFAAPGGQGSEGVTLAAYLGQQDPGSDPGGWTSASGAAYSRLLHALGAPAGIMQSGGPHGTDPSWLKKVLEWIGGGALGAAAGQAAGDLGGVAKSISGFTDAMGSIFQAVDWLLNPTHWVRIVCGIMGGGLVLSGVVSMTHVGSSIATPLGQVQRPAALPIGILEVGAGGVLLFVAFHNLPDSVTNVSQLLGYMRDQSQSAAEGKQTATAAAAADPDADTS